MHAAKLRSNALNSDILRANGRRELTRLVLLCVPAILLVMIVIVIPIGWLLTLSFYDDSGSLSMINYARFFDQSAYVGTFLTTFKVAFVVTGCAVLLAYPLAYMLSQLPERMASFCMIFVLLPFWTSVLVRTYAWMVILQRRGLVNTLLTNSGLIESPLAITNNFAGVVVAMTHIMIPFLVLPLYASMRTIDVTILRASMSLGAGPIATFWRVFFPLSLPGLASGVVIVFVLCLGLFVTPALMGGGNVPMWAMRMEQATSLYNNWGAAAALGILLLVVTLGILALFNAVVGDETASEGKY